MDREARARALEQAVAQEVELGARVLEQDRFTATVRVEQRTRHLVHLLATLVTLGLWAPAWLTLVVSRSLLSRDLRVDVDKTGRVTRTQVRGLGTQR